MIGSKRPDLLIACPRRHVLLTVDVAAGRFGFHLRRGTIGVRLNHRLIAERGGGTDSLSGWIHPGHRPFDRYDEDGLETYDDASTFTAEQLPSRWLIQWPTTTPPWSSSASAFPSWSTRPGCGSC
jgi:hypothetical protein